MQSFKKKIVSLVNSGLDPVIEGKHNYDNFNIEVEKLAIERLKDCDCLVDEPISFLRIEDKRIPELSNKMCDICGCTAAYKFRHSIEKCKKWRK